MEQEISFYDLDKTFVKDNKNFCRDIKPYLRVKERSSTQIILTETSKFTSYETTCLNLKREIYDPNSKYDTKDESIPINILSLALSFCSKNSFQKLIIL